MVRILPASMSHRPASHFPIGMDPYYVFSTHNLLSLFYIRLIRVIHCQQLFPLLGACSNDSTCLYQCQGSTHLRYSAICTIYMLIIFQQWYIHDVAYFPYGVLSYICLSSALSLGLSLLFGWGRVAVRSRFHKAHVDITIFGISHMSINSLVSISVRVSQGFPITLPSCITVTSQSQGISTRTV